MIIKYVKDLADVLNVGDRFRVRNGAWYGIIKAKDDTGITVDAYRDYACKNIVTTVHHFFDTRIDLEIDIIYRDRKIVFDCDDILWPLNERIAKAIGVKFSDLHTFSIFENTRLSKSQRNQVYAAYGDFHTFKHINWYAGAETIMDLENHGKGVKVFVNSNSCQEEIAALKYMQIHQLIDISDDQLILNVIDADGHKKKDIGDHVFAFIDDSPHNLLDASTKAEHLYTINTPWNINVPELDGLNIKRFDTLEEIIDDIGKLLDEK